MMNTENSEISNPRKQTYTTLIEKTRRHLHLLLHSRYKNGNTGKYENMKIQNNFIRKKKYSRAGKKKKQKLKVWKHARKYKM